MSSRINPPNALVRVLTHQYRTPIKVPRTSTFIQGLKYITFKNCPAYG